VAEVNMDTRPDLPALAPTPFPTWFDWLMSGMSIVVIGGFFLDLWAHEHDRVDDSFFTPWHAVMYAGVAGFGIALVVKGWTNRRAGASWSAALPVGYRLSLLGVALFLIGGVFDLAWHMLFGIEVTVDALFSPSHLVLAGAGLMMLTGPLRRAWNVGAPTRFPHWIPWVLSLTATFTMLTAFTQYAHPATDTWPAGFTDVGYQHSDLVLISADGITQTRLALELADGAVTPAVSPDGRRIAFSAQSFDEDGVHGVLYVMNTDGSGQKVLRDEPGETIFRPTWSPDGGLILYNAQIDENFDVFVLSAEGGEPTRLTTGAGMDVTPAWAPDGESFVFTSDLGGDPDLYTMTLDDPNPLLLLAHPGGDFSPSWSPDGGKVAFSADDDIYMVGADGTGLVRLTDDPAADWEPRFSPDGSTILFATNRDDQFEIYAMATDGSNVRNVSRHPGADDGWGGIAWLPDGSGFITNVSGFVPGGADHFFREAMGGASLWIQAIILAAFVLLIAAAGGVPLGAVTTLLSLNALAMAVLFDTYWYAVAVFVAGLLAEIVIAAVRPNPARPSSVRLVAAAVPGLWYGAYLVALWVQPDGIGWTLHMALGAPFVAAGIGYLLSLLVTNRPTASGSAGVIDTEAASREPTIARR